MKFKFLLIGIIVFASCKDSNSGADKAAPSTENKSTATAEIPKAVAKDTAIEAIALTAFKRDYADVTVLDTRLMAAKWDSAKDDKGNFTQRNINVLVKFKKADGKCAYRMGTVSQQDASYAPFLSDVKDEVECGCDN